MMKRNGFTLIELAIALMVIGLLIGGVLKGQELIENARITATMRQIKAYDTAVMMFRNTYNVLPGDIVNPGTRIPNCTVAICNTAGNGNGRIEPSLDEIYKFFVHLTKAGFITGAEGGTSAQRGTNPELFFPDVPVGGRVYGVSYIQGKTVYAANLSSTFAVSQNHGYNVMPILKSAERLDSKMDDGFPCSGAMTLVDMMSCMSGNTYAEQTWIDPGGVEMNIETVF